MIYKVGADQLDDRFYEANRFISTALDLDIELQVYAPDQIEIVVTNGGESSVFIDGHPALLPDFVLHRIGAGTTYFALSIIRHMERLGVWCINSADSIEKVKDKMYAHQLLAANHLPVPRTMLLKFPTNLELIEQIFTFPVVVKTISGSLGKGVFLAETKKQFMDLARMIEITSPKANVILQEMITPSKGTDLRVFVVGGRVIGCMKRTAAGDDFRANYSNGGTVENYPLSEDIEWLALESAKTLGLDIAGVDLLFDHHGYKICEVNGSPMFKGMESCNQVDIPKEIFHYIGLRFNRGEQ